MVNTQAIIHPQIWVLAPQFRAISISVKADQLINPMAGAESLKLACQHFLNSDFDWAAAHIKAWDEMYKKFGAKPQKTPNSAHALRKRVIKDGSLTSIDPIVDLYNAISIKYAVPVGGENIGAYTGSPHLVLSDGTEKFDTVKEGQIFYETPEPGEVIWKDDIGVTCRRWNWRQGVRTRLDSSAKDMWFILESLGEMPLEALEQAAKELSQGIQNIMPKALIHSHLIEKI